MWPATGREVIKTKGISLEKDLLRELFDYKDGQLIRRVSTIRTKVGDEIGCICNRTGYIVVGVNDKTYLAHRIIWIWHNGHIQNGLEVDHINRKRDDNNIDNLRLVTHQENAFNTAAKGYGWNNNAKKWHSGIKVNGKRKHLGYFDNEIDARNAYLNAKKELHQIEIH